VNASSYIQIQKKYFVKREKRHQNWMANIFIWVWVQQTQKKAPKSKQRWEIEWMIVKKITART
jgi:hypothetical protein